MSKLILVLTSIGKYDNGYTTYEVAADTNTICEDFLQKFKANEYVKAEGKLNEGCCANESILWWKSKFAIEILNSVENKQELERKLTDCLLELQKTDDGGWYN